jgi:hypothetical protein
MAGTNITVWRSVTACGMGPNTNVSEASAALICSILYYGSEGKRVYLNTDTSLTDNVILRPQKLCIFIPCREKLKALSVPYIWTSTQYEGKVLLHEFSSVLFCFGDLSKIWSRPTFNIRNAHIYVQLLKVLTLYSIADLFGRDNIHVAKSQPFTAEAWFQYQFCICGIYEEARGALKMGFLPIPRFYPVSIISPNAPWLYLFLIPPGSYS